MSSAFGHHCMFFPLFSVSPRGQRWTPRWAPAPSPSNRCLDLLIVAGRMSYRGDPTQTLTEQGATHTRTHTDTLTDTHRHSYTRTIAAARDLGAARGRHGRQIRPLRAGTLPSLALFFGIQETLEFVAFGLRPHFSRPSVLRPVLRAVPGQARSDRRQTKGARSPVCPSSGPP